MMIRSAAEASSAAISCSSRRRKVLNSQTCSMIWHCWPRLRESSWRKSFTRIPVTESSKVARSTNRFASFHRCHTGGSVTVVFMSSRATLLLIPNSKFCQVNMPGFSPREPSTSHPRDTLGLGPRGQSTAAARRFTERCICSRILAKLVPSNRGRDSVETLEGYRNPQGGAKAELAMYIGGSPEIYRRYTGGISDHHRPPSNVPPVQHARLPHSPPACHRPAPLSY